MIQSGIPRQAGRTSKGMDPSLTRIELILVLAAVFTVSLGYGVALPILPAMVERFVDAGPRVGWYTGAATGLFTAMLGLWAPVSGWLSDRFGRRVVALVGLGGFVPSMLLLGTADSMRSLYIALAATGACASAVLPVATALVGDRSQGDLRARHIAWVGTASLLGFMSGPIIGGWLGVEPNQVDAFSALTPFLVVALMAAAVWLSWHRGLRETSLDADSVVTRRSMPRVLLALTVILMYGVASFEVGLTLHARQSLQLDARDLSLLFMECSAIMVVFQALLFPFVRKHVSPHIALATSFGALAVAFALLPSAQELTTLMVLVALVSGGAGLLSPLLSYQLASGTPAARGFALGLQTAVSSAGQAVGSVAAGLLFGLMAVGPFWLTAALFAIGGAAGARLRVLDPAPAR